MFSCIIKSIGDKYTFDLPDPGKRIYGFHQQVSACLWHAVDKEGWNVMTIVERVYYYHG